MAGELHDPGQDDVIASINMIPFIDIALVLLIIFLVTSATIVQQSIQVNLPSAASGSETAPSSVAITVRSDGGLELNGLPIERASLLGAMRAEVRDNEVRQAILSADRDVDYGRVVDVLDIVIQSGVSSYALNIERRAPEAEN